MCYPCARFFCYQCTRSLPTSILSHRGRRGYVGLAWALPMPHCPCSFLSSLPWVRGRGKALDRNIGSRTSPYPLLCGGGGYACSVEGGFRTFVLGDAGRDGARQDSPLPSLPPREEGTFWLRKAGVVTAAVARVASRSGAGETWACVFRERLSAPRGAPRLTLPLRRSCALSRVRRLCRVRGSGSGPCA